MKGMAFQLIAEIIIGVASLIVLMMLFTPLPQAMGEGYCYMHNGFVAIIPFPEHMRPNPPSFCGTREMKGFERAYIRETSIELVSRRIASYALACLKVSGDATQDKDIVCYEIYLDEVSGTVTGQDVINEVPQEYRSKIEWKMPGGAGTNSVLAVHYVSSDGKVVIE